MGAGDDGQGGGQVVGQHGLVGGQARERVGNGRALVELESDDGRDGQPGETGSRGARGPASLRSTLPLRGRYSNALPIITCSMPASRKTSP